MSLGQSGRRRLVSQHAEGTERTNPINTSIGQAREVACAIVGRPNRAGHSAFLLILFCLANFIEILSGSATVPALGAIAKLLRISGSES